MKVFASLVGLLFVLALSPGARADSCSVPGHPQCSFTCPGNQQCLAKWVSTYGGACSHKCLPPKPPEPPKGTPHPGGIQPGKVVVQGGESKPYYHGEIVSPRDPQSGLPTGRRMHGEVIAKGRRCRSEAFDKVDAEDFCRRQLQCTNGMTCQGEARRWICWCK
jgi:hypothetical protein